jgi:hypothetical protein
MTYLSFITFLHTAISLIAIPLGIGAVRRLFAPETPAFWTTWFLWTAFLTSATGFIFPFIGITPAFVVGILATAILVAVYLARGKQPQGTLWRWTWAGGMVASLYLLVFVLIVQMFLKIGALNALAPTGTEPPFAIVQGITLLVFIGLGIQALRRYRP